METIIQEQDGKMVAFLKGRLDTAAAPETETAMNVLYDCNEKDIILDCTELEYISSRGLRILISLQQDIVANNGKMRIHNISSSVREVFDVTGLSKSFLNID